MEAKTANQLYKESGSTMPFKEWLEQERKHNASGLDVSGSFSTIIIDKSLNDSVQSAINTGKQGSGLRPDQKPVKTVLGIPQTYVLIAGGLVAVWVGYGVYKAFKN